MLQIGLKIAIATGSPIHKLIETQHISMHNFPGFLRIKLRIAEDWVNPRTKRHGVKLQNGERRIRLYAVSQMAYFAQAFDLPRDDSGSKLGELKTSIPVSASL